MPPKRPLIDRNHYPVLLNRHTTNPILSAKDWRYPVHSVFNPGAVRLVDGSTLLLCRVEDRRGISHLCSARSKNGVDGWKVDPQPTFVPNAEQYPEELWGVEDPRITYMEELETYIIAYTAFGRNGPGVAIATTKDFNTYERFGLIMQADDKDAAIFPKLINGEFALIHRPSNEQGAHMWISLSPDLRNWGGHEIILPARKGAWWDANKIGLGPPPVETEQGWLVFYHGVRRHASGSIYRVGLALFDIENPMVCLKRSQSWIFGPETEYETSGDVSHVVFPTGVTVSDDRSTLNIYYGASDSSICLATAKVEELLNWLDVDGEA